MPSWTNRKEFETVMREHNILPNLQDGLSHYMFDYIPTGGFLTAVLENNLVDSFARADTSSTENLKNICQFVYWELPRNCWGSREIVKKWLEGRNSDGASEVED